MSANPISASNPHSGGFDLLRLGAMLLVTIQHALTLTGHENWTTVGPISVGQLGVAIFLGLSTLLAGTSPRPPLQWLIRRFVRLYPAYWLVMIASFVAAWITQYKPFGYPQFLSQLLGIGLLTHPGNLINVPTWFISLLLVCYFCTFVIRVSRRPLLATLFLAATFFAWSGDSSFSWPWMHMITFFVTSAITFGCPDSQRTRGLFVVGLIVLLFVPLSVAFAYTGLTLLLTGTASCLSAVPHLINRLAKFSYEYYLIHGPLLLLTTLALPHHPVISVACGIVLAFSGAVFLNRCVDLLTSNFGKATRVLSLSVLKPES